MLTCEQFLLSVIHLDLGFFVFLFHLGYIFVLAYLIFVFGDYILLVFFLQYQPAQRLAGKNFSEMTYCVLSGTTARVLASQAEAIIHTGKTWPQAT